MSKSNLKKLTVIMYSMSKYCREFVIFGGGERANTSLQDGGQWAQWGGGGGGGL